MWEVEFHDEFQIEFDNLADTVQDAILASAKLLENFGPKLGRPHVDTLSGSKFARMKELRCAVNDGQWRIAFAFGPDRRAILLIAGNKAGVSQKRFYKQLIAKADERYNTHLKVVRTKE